MSNKAVAAGEYPPAASDSATHMYDAGHANYIARKWPMWLRAGEAVPVRVCPGGPGGGGPPGPPTIVVFY